LTGIIACKLSNIPREALVGYLQKNVIYWCKLSFWAYGIRQDTQYLFLVISPD
jgi:hypothetical protein